ncbi:hypothetical protein FGU71_00560 [Erythrobacter insulae]|uniref:DUF2946 domain-containing protein n=1 Tax=Erythrobacter insulae TaxID=2584124 RepID=A0A547P8X0_9SPHN|nr:hypothetical protein [Erythrobacter insulae]TRD10504.1 hypothetical protein FGU71_00560 [Erythrobacter insulae]
MHYRSRSVLLTLMLMAIAVRTVFGAPCCIDQAQAAPLETHAAKNSHSQSAETAQSADDPYSDHADKNTANPCCSACGPTLPPETASANVPIVPRAAPEPAPIRELATRPPYPAYNATGPPLLI